MASWSQTTNVWTYPSADAFVWAQDPTGNFGHAGALAVSGALARNLAGEANGEFSSLIRFPTAGINAALNAALGTNNWSVTRVELRLSEDSDPDNPIFNTGVGAFEVRWLASTNWLEGTGKPKQVRTDGVCYQQLLGLLNPLNDVTLGQFTNSGADLHLTFILPLSDVLITNIQAGAPLNFFLAPVSPTIGFTFYSRNFPNGPYRAALDVTASISFNFIRNIALAPSNQVTIYFSVPSNTACQVQSCPSFPSAGGWTPIFTTTPAPTNRNLTVLDTVTNTKVFYRLLSSP